MKMKKQLTAQALKMTNSGNNNNNNNIQSGQSKVSQLASFVAVLGA